MSNINNLTNKIIEDAEATAKQIVDEARIKEKNTINKKVSEAEKEKKIILSRAESEAKIRAERIVSNAHLQARNMKLSAKGETLDNVFKAALTKLNALPQEEFLKFMKDSILSLDIDGDEEVIVDENNSAVTPKFIEEVNKALKAKGKLGQLKLSFKKNLSGGYIIAKNGIGINNTFESLIKSSRDELEAEVASVLFS
ncbi:MULTISPECIES: V-type ATP synthase subunit E [Clostridium]|uniref:V-type proton ATPase subunit E n=2 Tax=Clostridium TaxID=1485 RepID=A0A151ARV3_9CLOT|nr:MULTISPECIES: V-type ATP synthase subunit E family protein [Clostridium]KYH30310.1 V-type proton ATPase subunit E [Clostridium colicanis DSM 13634]MBE6044467.1 V-type ATP synthase subunit E [Clostridium thermopalmarium]PRR69424.1 V-type ATP synthase subunit E [Clostridium thermopalmarium DSM 5974]PVZ26310.1 V/A-type H+-transporting ATPase subunit E [Clostridium thermopalmarium DSM 5974]